MLIIACYVIFEKVRIVDTCHRFENKLKSKQIKLSQNSELVKQVKTSNY